MGWGQAAEGPFPSHPSRGVPFLTTSVKCPALFWRNRQAVHLLRPALLWLIAKQMKLQQSEGPCQALTSARMFDFGKASDNVD